MNEKKSKHVRYVEMFLSLEGEGPQTGVPTAYLRTTGCTFTCRGFNNPNMIPITNEVLGFNPADAKTLHEVPGINVGCDTIYSFDKRFKHLWKSESVDVVVDKLLNMLPFREWIHPETNMPIMFSMTGGEPMLHQEMWMELLDHPKMQPLQSIIIESNLAVKIKPDFQQFLVDWLTKNQQRTLYFSNSPKMSNSGEPYAKAVVPDNLIPQLEIAQVHPQQVFPYLKFVTEGSDKTMGDIVTAIFDYNKVVTVYQEEPMPVYLMPEACNQEQQTDIAGIVADICIHEGYIFSYRLQNALWGNEIGT